jgi:pilin isopeptide linkage protein
MNLLRKRAASLGLALLLTVGASPFQAFASDQAAQDSATIDIPVTLAFLDEEPPEGEPPGDPPPIDDIPFTFILQANEEGEPVPEEHLVTIEGEGTTAFEEITFDEPGEYEYTVFQRDDGVENIIYDTSAYFVDVNVKYDNDGDLVATYSAYQESGSFDGRSEGKASEIMFINEYDDDFLIEEKPETSEEPTPSEEPAPSEAPVASEQPTVSPAPSEEPATVSPAVSPTTSETPAESVQPSTAPSASPKPSTTTTATATSTPKTGDDTNNLPWIAVICVVAFGVAGCVLYLNSGKRRNP